MADEMSSSVNTAGRIDVNVTEDGEIRFWTDTLAVTERQLREAVAAVGTSATDVRQHLGLS